MAKCSSAGRDLKNIKKIRTAVYNKNEPSISSISRSYSVSSLSIESKRD